MTDTFERGHDPRRRCVMSPRKPFTPEFKRERTEKTGSVLDFALLTGARLLRCEG